MWPHYWYLTVLNTVVGALVGALVVYYFGLRQQAAQRRAAFRERQLTEFYAPLAGIRNQILAKSDLRARVAVAAESAWQDICASYGQNPMFDQEKRFAPFLRIIEYENEQLKAELVPKYQEMLTLFTERYHLAAPDTRSFCQEFLDFVEVWNRWLSDSLPREVWAKLDHSEERVKPFYEHLNRKMQELQDEAAQD